MTINRTTLWIAGSAFLAVLLIAGTYLLAVSPARAQVVDTQAQTTALEQSNQTLQQQTALLKSQFATLDQQRAELASITSTLPSSADVPSLLRQFDRYAAGAGVTVISVTPGTPENYAGTDSSVTGIVDIPVSLVIGGGFPQTQVYLKNLQADMNRYFLVENVQVGVGSPTGEGDVSTTITGKVFVLTDAAGLAATTGGAISSTTTTTTTTAGAPAVSGTVSTGTESAT